MKKNMPNKWLRKAIKDQINGIVVNGKTVNCFDTNVTGSVIPEQYVVLSTQSNDVDKRNKCEYFWDSDILIDIVTRYNSTGNTGSRLLADDITDQVRVLTDSLVLDSASGLSIIWQRQTFPNSLESQTENTIIFRNFIRISLKIK